MVCFGAFYATFSKFMDTGRKETKRDYPEKEKKSKGVKVENSNSLTPVTGRES